MNPDQQKTSILQEYHHILRNYSFESDLLRDKSILNFSFAIFMGLLAFFNFIRFNTPAVVFGILAMLFSLVSIYLSLNVLNTNSYLAIRVLEDINKTNPQYQNLLSRLFEQNKKDGTWAYRSLWATIICLVLCVLFYSGIKIDFANFTLSTHEIPQELILNSTESQK